MRLLACCACTYTIEGARTHTQADVNAQGHRGMTALMLAVAHGHRDTTQMLAVGSHF
ncbi:MAG: ankyrin repeat domain-containing protein [Promethearchaeia archaeon]